MLTSSKTQSSSSSVQTFSDSSNDVSVIIPAYNNQETIAQTLEALLGQVYLSKIEIIVIDDHSSDNTRKIIDKFPVIKINNDTNLGLARSINKGILSATYDIVVTLHADTIPVNTEWLTELVRPLIGRNVAATCSTQLPPDYEKRRLTIWEKMVYAKLSEDQALNDKADAYKKSVLIDIGLFDDKTYRTAGEDEDLSLRLRLNGKEVVGTPARVIHEHHYNVHKGQSVLSRILRKEFTFGKAGGALRRKYPKHKLGSYIFPDPKSFTNDGLFRVSICLGALIPYLQLLFIPIMLVAASFGVTTIIRRQKSLATLYPFFNVIRFYSYTAGYIMGIVIGRQ